MAENSKETYIALLEQIINEQQEQRELLEEILEKLENLSLPGPGYHLDYES